MANISNIPGNRVENNLKTTSTNTLVDLPVREREPASSCPWSICAVSPGVATLGFELPSIINLASLAYECSTPLIVHFLQLLFLLVLPRALGSSAARALGIEVLAVQERGSRIATHGLIHPFAMSNRQCSIDLNLCIRSVRSGSIHTLTVSNQSRSIHSQCTIDLDPCRPNVQSISIHTFAVFN